MNNAELREFCTQMIGKFKLLSDIQKEMQYETIDAKFTEWELKKLIFALNVLREEVRKYVDTADTPQTERRTDRDGDVWEWRGDAWYCIGQANTPQTDCEACELDGKADVCKICRTSNYEPQTDCGWGKPTTVSHREDKED